MNELNDEDVFLTNEDLQSWLFVSGDCNYGVTEKGTSIDHVKP